MKLTAKLALSQIKSNRNRSIMTLLGIVLSSAMLTAVCGYVESARKTIYNALGLGNAGYHFTLIAIGAVLGVIIVAASVIVVSNAFRISAGERMRQFGILKSVGATKKQIALTVLYEGIFLCAIGIPIGIATGLVIEFIGISIITNLLNSLASSGAMHVDSEAFLNVPFATPPLMFVVAVVISFVTVLFSAGLPAYKVAKIPAIDAIRNTGEIKMKRKNVRTSKLTQVLFGFEGTLATKSLKRSRRNFRATIISITVSIVLLIAAGSFGSMMKNATNLMFPVNDASAIADWTSDVNTKKGKKVTYVSLDTNTAENITKKFRQFDNAKVFGIGGVWHYKTKMPNGSVTKSALISVDAVHYEQLCKTAGVPLGSNLLLNIRRENKKGKKTEYAPYKFSELKGQTLAFSLTGNEPIKITITGELTGKDIPNEIFLKNDFKLAVIVSECEMASYTWFTKVDDVVGFKTYAKSILNESTPKSVDGMNVYTDCIDIEDATKPINDIVHTIMYFVYGFVGMLTLIAVTSVISTINTNIRSRAREFAALESVGMTQAGIKKMLNLESILCSVKSLLFGLPLGILGAYGLYQAMGFSVELPFHIPWFPILECVIGVFIVTWVTMRYSASQLKDGNIIETIRGE